MGVASLVIGIVALLLGMMGFIPAIGVVSLLAPVLSLFGCVLGGVGISRAKQEGVSSGLAVGGLVINIVALLITLPIALTCGACNACLATGAFMGGSDGGVRWERTDGGAYIWRGGSGAPTYAPGYPPPPTAPSTPMMPMQPAPPGAPAPAFPPPPMPVPGAAPPADPTLAPPMQAPTPSSMPPTPPVAPAPSTSVPARSGRDPMGGLAPDLTGAVGPESPVERAAARARGAARGARRRADPTAAGF